MPAWMNLKAPYKVANVATAVVQDADPKPDISIVTAAIEATEKGWFPANSPADKAGRRAFGILTAASLALATFGTFTASPSVDKTTEMLNEWDTYMVSQDNKIGKCFEALRRLILSPELAHLGHAVFAAAAALYAATRPDDVTSDNVALAITVLNNHAGRL